MFRSWQSAIAAASATGSATVIVPGALPVAVVISAAPATVPAGTTASLTATVTGDTANLGVTWSILCSSTACGTISPTATASGVAATYTAPANIPVGDLSISVIATSIASPAASAAANFTVPGTQVSIDSQSTSDVQAGGTAQIVASVVNDPANKGVTWTVSCDTPPCGTVSPTATASGANTTYTAPSTPPPADLPVTISATSVFNSGASNFAVVTVHAVSISVSPVSLLLPKGQTQDFIATVADDPANKGVTWTVTRDNSVCLSGCGSVSPSSTASGATAIYTAPPAVPANPVISLIATSVEDTTKTASASVTLTVGQVKLVPNTLSFLSRVGATSPAKQVTLTNTGTSTLNISGITSSAVFPQTNDCGTSVGAGMSCTLNITFQPSTAGTVDRERHNCR